jgi:hypothetical protein
MACVFRGEQRREPEPGLPLRLSRDYLMLWYAIGS